MAHMNSSCSCGFVSALPALPSRSRVQLASAFLATPPQKSAARAARSLRHEGPCVAEFQLDAPLLIGAGAAVAAAVAFLARAQPPPSAPPAVDEPRVRIRPLDLSNVKLPAPGDDDMNNGELDMMSMNFWDWTNLVYGRVGRFLAPLTQVNEESGWERPADSTVMLLCCWCGATGRELGLFELREAAKWGQDVADWKARVQRIALFGERAEDQQAWNGQEETEAERWKPAMPEMPAPPASIQAVLEEPARRLATGRPAALLAVDCMRTYLIDALELPIGRREAALVRSVVKGVFPHGADGSGSFPTVEVTREEEGEEEAGPAKDFEDIRVDFRLEHPELALTDIVGDIRAAGDRIDADDSL
eukprot:tig00001501_g9218.t1